MRWLIVVIAVSIGFGCRRSEAPAVSTTRGPQFERARGEIDAAVQNYERWLAAGQLDSILTIMTDDYQAQPPNQRSVSGKTSMRAWMGPLLSQGRWNEHITSQGLEVSGPIAVQWGRYTLDVVPHKTVPRGTSAVSDTGKFLWYWRNVDGHWRLAVGAWNSDRSAAQ